MSSMAIMPSVEIVAAVIIAMSWFQFHIPFPFNSVSKVTGKIIRSKIINASAIWRKH